MSLFDSCFKLIIYTEIVAKFAFFPHISWYFLVTHILFVDLGPSRIQVLRRAASVPDAFSPKKAQILFDIQRISLFLVLNLNLA